MMTIFTFVGAFFRGFFSGGTPHSTVIKHEKRLRDQLDEGQIDSMVDDSFPASDPPSTY